MHQSVLLKEVVTGLALKQGAVFVDGTLNTGGHSKALCHHLGEKLTIIGIDQDKHAIATAKKDRELGHCLAYTFEENFRNLDTVLKRAGYQEVDGVLLDLGFSSDQLESSGRGFSFQKDEPLIMTLKANPGKHDLTALDVINDWQEENLAAIIRGFGEDPKAYRIAKAIVRARALKKIETTTELREIIIKAVGGKRGRIDPATKTFQALRIVVNDELGALKEGLSKAWEHLKPGGRLAVISFHSLEDRIVKHFMKDEAKMDRGTLISKKPIIAGTEEIKKNPRARSAKLRIIEKKELL
jgi:16S rRNA (cytosine1402-N4)-methyltransferase